MRKLIPAALVAIMLLTVSVAALPSSARALDRAANERAMLKLINKARTSRGLAPVRLQKALDRAALAHSREMLSRDYIAHTSWKGASLGTRLARAGYSRTGCRSWSVGEVIGWGKGAVGTPRAVFRTWMKSSGHRAVILRARWRDVGIGCAGGSLRNVSGVAMYSVDFGRRIR